MHVPEAKDYRLVYDLDLTTVGPQFGYTLDHSQQVIAPFDRIAYCLELENDSDSRFAYVSMDAFTTDATKIGVPTAASGARFQEAVANLNVFSNVPGVVTGEGLAGGHIEFWPNNYQQANVAGVPGASGTVYDFGDGPSDPTEGYGCMQVHNVEAKQTILAFNHWRAGRSADVGIGNNPGEHPDWTFSKSAEGQTKMRLRVLVREKGE
jgi:sialate O-acetylesterase